MPGGAALNTITGDVWAVPYMPRDQWEQQRVEIWGAVHLALKDGWGGKLQQARRLTGLKPFIMPVAIVADDLGAPVGQMFTACSLRLRRG